MKEPKAIDPKWYLKVHHNPVDTDPLPLVSELQVKYQVQHVTARVN
jgi:hypothetical protein